MTNSVIHYTVRSRLRGEKKLRALSSASEL
jgi:hypothetical protein